ncbi:predicted protein [Histoplasma mississippiense (nom. inval.)]|uniref:predicted protein n=1 Tax=Ajellomyces capsulatus (strain NAm1 / WU24) TaxID=2059318 RepID=UPI000157D082|nr:predicted protein [Histoplasma mississippiense (nom. inval.)]EDN11043.1 predicted protein [Histoplasma mississippiense (nom. inval.)]
MALHRHKSSLEGFLDFSEPFSLTPQQNKAASGILNKLIEDYGLERTGRRGYMPAMLINATFEHVHAQSKDAFLNFFILYIHEHLDGNTAEPDISLALAYLDGFSSFDTDKKSEIRSLVELFADYMVDNFFTPLRASSVKTPQPTPVSLSSMQASTPTGITQRVSILRQSCLIRDHHRCVVSHRFDRKEAQRRIKQDGIESKDDDGELLRNEPGEFEYLEVAHILPHSLNSMASGNTELSDSKKNVIQLLTMFEPGITHLIEGQDIDSPKNALTLTHHYHRLLGEFEIYFEPIEGAYNRYMIKSTERDPILRDRLLPVTRTLSLSPSRTIDPPSSRLLKVHRAIALILKLSGAGEYIENILRDMEDVKVKEDGSTNLGRLLSLRLGGWLRTLAVF